jgi:hypothetical protein
VTNQNDVQLYVKSLEDGDFAKGVSVVSGIEMHDLHWLGDGMHVLALIRDRGRLVVVLINVKEKASKIIARTNDADITEYSVDEQGKTLVFAADAGNTSGTSRPEHEEIEQGYLIQPMPQRDNLYHQARLFVVSSIAATEWSKPIELQLTSPLTNAPIQSLSYVNLLHLSMSPDGSSLLFSLVDSEHIPSAWMNNPIVKPFKELGVPLELTVIHGMKTQETKMSFASSFVYQTPVWADDSSSYVMVSTAAVNEPSPANGSDSLHGLPPPHVYSVNRISGIAEEVTSVSAAAPQVLYVDRDGDILLRPGNAAIERISRKGGRWKTQSPIVIPVRAQRSRNYTALATDGRNVVGDYEDAATPPEVFIYSIGQTSIHVLATLNPEFNQLQIAPTRAFSWRTSDGYQLHGTLWLPPDYKDGVKYPLVIQTKPDVGDFACDSGGNHDPSFAPQPIANVGMIYLARTRPIDYRGTDDEAHYPKGYPGGLSEAAFQMDVWDSAVRALVQQGIVAPNRVGIIGFSRTGWYVEYILAHSAMRYQAATAADNVLYSMGDYWVHQTQRAVLDSELLYGGPPYGPTLNNWREYSISFNLDKIRTPLLMEVFGEGIEYAPGKSIPDTLVPAFEIVTALAHFKQPAALYYYQNDVHQPNHPQTRLASLQRNLDWYRFWLQGCERPEPQLVDQYLGWRKLRELGLSSEKQLPSEH